MSARERLLRVVPPGATWEDQRDAYHQVLRELLTALRKARGLTQRQLSEQAGLASGRVARLEQGDVPTLWDLRQLAGALGFTAAELLERVEVLLAPPTVEEAEAFAEQILDELVDQGHMERTDSADGRPGYRLTPDGEAAVFSKMSAAPGGPR